MEGFNFDNATEGEELNPSAYNPDDYPTKEELLDFISLNCNKPPVNIDLKELSINGVVKRDPMDMYLQSRHISSSNLKNALKTPRSFYYDYERVFEEKELSYWYASSPFHNQIVKSIYFIRHIV